MRYVEIISDNYTAESGVTKRTRVMQAISKSHDALRTYRDAQVDIEDQRRAARREAPGAARADRMRSLDRREQQARAKYGAGVAKADDKRRAALAKSR